MNDTDRIITIDGPAGAGKSTVARSVANGLEWTYLDTGAMYRVVGLAVKEAGVNPDDDDVLASLLEGLTINIISSSDDPRILLSERDVTEEIRTPRISELASRVSARNVVRQTMLRLQRQAGAAGNIVAEGRDMGTVVFPKAGLKIFLDATLDVRANRRYLELKSRGDPSTLSEVKQAMAQRDQADSSRHIAPLAPATDAWMIDTSSRSIQDLVHVIQGTAKKKFGI
jgi:CMP/dCMP kinase